MNFISHTSFVDFLGSLSHSFRVIAPYRENGRLSLQRYPQPGQEPVSGEVRACEPLKSFLFQPRQEVARGLGPSDPILETMPLCLVGVKSCDLRSLVVQDHVFMGDPDFPDPPYRNARDSCLIISADCTSAADTCFCRALEVNPYPAKGFDLNLSPVEGGFVVSCGSEKGSRILSEYRVPFSRADSTQVAEVADQRQAVTRLVEHNLAARDIPLHNLVQDRFLTTYNAPFWAEEAAACVECNACTAICPTCHCFLLYDQAKGSELSRFRAWDSCLDRGFARVAGGGNPRPKLWMRLRNRFEKKFFYFPRVLEVSACTGCGRCIAACPARIDIRRVMRRIVDHVAKP